MNGRLRGAFRDESGFTLIELIVSTTILIVIMAPLVAGLIVTLQTEAGRSRLSESHDEQISTVYFAGDAASTEDFPNPLTSTCFSQGSAPSSTPAFSLHWKDPTGLSATSYTDTYVDYSLDTASPKRLFRTICSGATVATQTLAHEVTSVSVACLPTAACTSASTEVDMTITEKSGRTFTLKGKRRTQ